jgi:hypothetical protein
LIQIKIHYNYQNEPQMDIEIGELGPLQPYTCM